MPPDNQGRDEDALHAPTLAPGEGAEGLRSAGLEETADVLQVVDGFDRA